MRNMFPILKTKATSEEDAKERKQDRERKRLEREELKKAKQRWKGRELVQVLVEEDVGV